MPGKKPYDAFLAFVSPLANALSCLVNAKLTPSSGGKNDVDVDHQLYISGANEDGYVRLGATPGMKRIELRARMGYRIIRDERPAYGPFRVTTLWYDYSIRRVSGEAIIDHHWHPDSKSHEIRPHIHFGNSELSSTGVIQSSHHILSGRITFETAIRTAAQFGAYPIRDDWEKRLDVGEAPHIRHRTWA